MASESRYEIWKSEKNNQWYWHYKAANNQIVAGSEGYHNKQDCLHAIDLLKASGDAEVHEK